MMGYFPIILVPATFLCPLLAVSLFAFAIVVMPGIGRLDDRGFMRAFQVIDGIVQNNQAVFMAVWLGSALARVLAAVTGWELMDTVGGWLLIALGLRH